MRARTAEAFEIKGGEAHGDLGRCLKFRQASLAALIRIGAVEKREWREPRARTRDHRRVPYGSELG